MANVNKRLEKLERKSGVGKNELIIKIRQFSFEDLGEETVKTKPETCPGCDSLIAEGRKNAVNGVVVLQCPDACPNLGGK